MTGLFAFLWRVVGPLALRVLAAVGIGLITVKGVDVGLGAVTNLVTAKIGGLPADMASILGRMGFGVAMGYILGAASFIVSYLAASKAFSFLGSLS